jgi:CHAT domain-containing protein
MTDLGPSPTVSTLTEVTIRILDRQRGGYPVEITLDGEREFPRGYLTSRVLRLLAPGTDESRAGERLFELLFADPRLREAWAETRGSSRRRRVRLRIDPLELRPLPWELLPSAPGKPAGSLAAGQNTPFSRYLPSPTRPGRLISERPLKALVAIANPVDLADYHLPTLDVAAEEHALKAIAAGIAEERVTATFLEPPVTRAALLRELQRGYHLLHLVAHGGSQRSSGEPGLFLGDERNRVALVTQGELAGVVESLGDSLRLVFLASCCSAAGAGEAFQGLAPALLAAGVPAVVALRERVSAETVRQFALTFYQRLEAHGEADLAANEARRALLDRGLPGGACPVLYMRLKDDRLFVPTPQPTRSAAASGTPSAASAQAAPRPPRNLLPAARSPLSRLVLNGVDGSTGEYFHPAFSSQEAVRLALRATADAGRSTGPEAWRQSPSRDHLGEEIDPTDLASAGWGVIFARDADREIREALEPLLRHRQRQAGRKLERRFRELSGEAGLWRGESKIDFLHRYGIGHGPPDPDKLPYYLLLVGSPAEISYEFQSQLDVQYAVGRLCLDSPAAYQRYAEAVVAAETRGTDQPRRAAFFGVENADDRMTFLTSEYLIRPLAEKLRLECGGSGSRPAWDIETVLGEEARKDRLAGFLGGPQLPALLFTACHGVAFPSGDRRQLGHQGALLCSDWPGPAAWGAGGQRELPEEHYFSGDDLPSDARLAGLIAFNFACYGAGTPQCDSYRPADEGGARALAPRDFVARLPQRLLEQGALAVVGHLDRAWGYSFIWKGTDDIRVFEQACQRLLGGYPVGFALDAFHFKFAELSADLMAERVRIDSGKGPDESLLASLWTAAQDARNYVILGDPAARLPAADVGAEPSRR